MIEKNKYGKHQKDVVYLFKNKMICGHCGKSVCSESGTARNQSVIRYYKCSGRKRGSSCQKSVIQKDILEHIIIKATIQLLNDSDIIEWIADEIIHVRKKRQADQSILNLLRDEKRQTEKALDNIVIAIEKGIVSKTNQRRLDELESKLQKLEENIAVEECKKIQEITREDIIRFLKAALVKEPKSIIDLLIKKIILYDDKIEI